MIGFPKPEPRARAKRRRDRADRKVAKTVRQLVDDRDGYCRLGPVLPEELYQMVGSCDGPSEWAHLGDSRRFKTRGMAPERRHTEEGSLKMCRRHHALYDSDGTGRLEISSMSAARGAKGPLRYRRHGRVYVEGER